MSRAAQVRGRLGDVLPVGLGLVAVGLSSYGLLGVAAHHLPPALYAGVGSLFLITNILGVGIFHAVEQEVNREVSTRSAAGLGSRPVIRSALVVCGALVFVVLVALVGAGPWLVGHVFAGSLPLLGAAAVGVVGSAMVYVLRGTFAGRRKYGWYASTMLFEGGSRLLLAGLLALLAVGTVGAYGYALAGALVIAVVPTIGGLRGAPDGPPLPIRPMAGRVSALVGTLGMTYLVANLAPVVLTGRLPGTEAALSAAFVSAFVLTRAPIFLFAPVQAFLLPAVTGALERGDVDRIRFQIRVLVGAVLAVGSVGGVAIVAIGPWITRTFLSSRVDLDRSTFALLSLSVLVMMIAQVLQPLLLGLGRHRPATAAWALGTLVFLGLLLSPLPALPAALAAQLAGPVCVLVVMATSVRRGLREVGRLTSPTAHSTTVHPST
jgi:O-antigen/teichoic acid export membrane protein